MSRTKYKNNHTKENYDRISLLVPKGQKIELQKIATNLDISLNEYINLLISNDISSGSSKLAEMKKGFSDEQKRMLDKWQVGRKYHEMINSMSYTKDDGYFIYLKKGYINDVTKSRVIHCNKTSELRSIINKSHKI